MKNLGWTIIAIILIVILVLIFSGGDSDTRDDTGEEIAKEAIENVIDDLRLSGLVSGNAEIEVKKIEEKDWPDACLGISEVDTLCAQVITPGFEITLEAEDRDFIYRTNKDGDFVVLAEQRQ